MTETPSQRSTVPGQPPVDPALNADARKSDLYSAIAKNDEEIIVVPKKKRQSPFMAMVVSFMKITFYIDSQKRSHESLFHFLGGLWAGIMALIYLGGMITLFLSVYARARLPLYLENFFENNNLKYDSLKMANYSLSRIQVTNLHDSENRYVIPQLNIQSTFADFLQGRIRTVTAEGVQLNVKSSDKNIESLEGVLKALGMITNPEETGLDLKVNSITVNNAVLNIETKNKKIPIYISSLSGLYTKEAQVIVRFNMDEEFLKMDASLGITGSSNERKLDLTINSGTLALANRAPEELQGTVNIKAALNKITSVQSNINLNYGYNLKTIEANLNSEKKGFSGGINFVLKNTSETAAKPLADFSLRFDELTFSKEGGLSTSSPLQMKINRLVRNATVLEGIEGSLNGELNCNLPETECHYNLGQETQVRYQNLAIKYKDQEIVIDDAGDILFLPSSNTLSLKLKDSSIGLNWSMAKLNLDGYYNTPTNSLHMGADSCQISGHFSIQVNQDAFDVKVANGFYQTPSLTMKGIQLTAEDLYNPTAPIYFLSQEVTTSSSLLTQPVSVEMRSLNRKVSANVQVKDTNIKLIAEGTFQPFHKTFMGQIQVPAFELKDIPFALSELSPIFSKRINQPSGQIMLKGDLKFSGAANVSGPLLVELKDVNFHLDEIPIQEMNGVIKLDSLLPLVSPAREIQYLSVGKVDSLVPLTNLLISFQLENQALRLLGVNAELGNEKLTLSSALIPYRSPNALLNFRSDKDFKISQYAPFLDLTGILFATGTGTLAIPVDISEKGIRLTSATLKLNNNVTLRHQKGQEDALGLFEKGNETYIVYRGQLVYDREGDLLVDFDGLFMPSRKREAFLKKEIHLDHPLFKPGKIKPIPPVVQALWQKLKEESAE